MEYIHVVGTNGKGSITAILYAIFKEAGINNIQIKEKSVSGTMPLITVITRCSDSDINSAAETVKVGIPVITNNWYTEIKVINERARAVGASVINVIAKDIEAWVYKQNDKAYVGFGYKGQQYKTTLRGKIQAVNCVLCIEICSLLNASGYNITRKNIDSGFERVAVCGCFETINKKPLVIFDKAGNPDAIKIFVQNVNDYFGRSMQKSMVSAENLHPKPFKRLIIFALKKTADPLKCLTELCAIKQNLTLIFTGGPSDNKIDSGFWPPDYLQKTFHGIYNGIIKTFTMDFTSAIMHAVQNFPEHKILITGSFELYKQAVDIFKQVNSF